MTDGPARPPTRRASGRLGSLTRLRARLAGLGPAPERLRARDHREYIVSARRHGLFILALGAFSASLASDESQRRAATALYGYLEKLVAVGVTLGAHDTSWHAAPNAPRLSVQALASEATWQPLFAAMVGPEAELVRLEPRTQRSFETTVDPADDCAVEAYRVAPAHRPPGSAPGTAPEPPPDTLALVVGERLDARRVALDNAVIVRFPGRCRPLPYTPDALVTMEYEASVDPFAVVFDDSVYDQLGFLWTSFIVRERMTLEDAPDRAAVRRELFGPFLTAEQIDRLDAYAYPFLKALDHDDLQAALTRYTAAQFGPAYASAQSDDAVQAILSHGTDPTGLWGFQFERRVAARVAPLALLVLCFSFWYRVRRIDPAGDLRTEPWLALDPRGFLETLGALVWVLLTVTAVGAVAWATYVYELSEPFAVPADLQQQGAAGQPASRWQLGLAVARGLGLWGGIAELAALAFLLLAWESVRRVITQARRSEARGVPGGRA